VCILGIDKLQFLFYYKMEFRYWTIRSCGMEFLGKTKLLRLFEINKGDKNA